MEDVMSYKIKRIKIEQCKGFKNFAMEVNENITVLVGANGTGKTTILEIVYNLLSGNTEYFLNIPNFTSIYMELNNGNYIKFVRKENSIQKYINNIQIEENNDFFASKNAIYFPAEGTFKNYEVNGPKKQDMINTSVILDADTMSRELKQFLINEKYQDLNDIADGKKETATRIEKYKKIYNNFLSDKRFIGIDNNTFEPLFELNETKERITIDKLSLGEKQIFFKGGSLLQYGEEEEIVVLIDEPEASMHPEWQQKILNFYRDINPNAQFIFATHSPHIVSSCKKEEIKVIVKEGNKLYIDEDIENTYGLTNEEILFKIFNLESVRDLTVQKEIDEYKRLFSKGKLLTEQEKDKMKCLKEQLEKTVGLSKSDITLLEFESDTNRYKEILNRLGEK